MLGHFINRLLSRPLPLQVLIAVALVCLWQAMAMIELGGPGALPGPLLVLAALATELSSKAGWVTIADTLLSWVVGLVIAIVFGVLVGALLGLSRFTYRSTRGLFDFARSVPPIALLPMGVFLIGTGRSLPVTMIIWTCMWPLVLQTMYGVRDVDTVAADAMRSLRLTRFQKLIWLVGPSALPYIMTGIRISAVMSLVVSIGTELIVSLPGIGYALYHSQYSGQIPRMYAYVLISAFVGSIITFVFTRLQARSLRWHPSYREVA